MKIYSEYLRTTSEKIEEMLHEEQKNKEADALNKFNQLLSAINLTQSDEKEPRTLVNSLSGGNLKIKVTREEYEIKEDSKKELKSKKS